MATPSSCCTPCCDETELINIPGIQGTPGAAGAAGTDGKNAFTITTADFDVPAVDDSVIITVANTSWMIVGQILYIANAGAFQVLTVTDTTHITALYLNYTINTNSGNTISAGAQVSPSGNQIFVSGILPFTDNTTGVVSNTLAVGTAIQTITFYIEAASIANGDLMTNYVPGYKFKIIKFDARCAKPVTTAARAANLNLEIGTTDLTGGVVALAGLYALGAAQAGSTISGANSGNATDSFSIEASSVTAFAEGAFTLIVSLQQMDTADSIASLAKKTNDLITALSP